MFFKFLNPHFFRKFAASARPYILFITIILLSLGIYLALFKSPEDYQQGEMVRLMYIHVPSAWLSLMIFMIMGLCSLSNLIWRASFAFYIALASAPIGASFAFITLATGMIWGKPIWGTYWVWDARLTSMLILFIFYICYIVIASASKNINKVEKPASAIAILGMINVPIVKFSVDLWYSLHQPASIFKTTGPSVDPSMLLPLFIMFFANLGLYCYILSLRIEIIFLKNGLRSY
jgi:heme exporter protein C